MKHLKQFVAGKFPTLQPSHVGQRYGIDLWNSLHGKRILFHPSSGMDHSSVLYFNRDWLNMLEDDGPEVIIRTDGMIYDSIFSRRDLYDSQRLIAAEFAEGTFDRRVLYIHQTTIMRRKLIVIELYGILNEDVLRCFLEDGTEVRYLYSYCDGIMGGMGAMNPEGIPTLYYTYFFNELGTRYQVSEYLREEMILKPVKEERHDKWMSHIRTFVSGIRRRGVGMRILSTLNDRWCPPEGARFIQLNQERSTEFAVRDGFYPIGMLCMK